MMFKVSYRKYTSMCNFCLSMFSLMKLNLKSDLKFHRFTIYFFFFFFFRNRDHNMYDSTSTISQGYLTFVNYTDFWIIQQHFDCEQLERHERAELGFDRETARARLLDRESDLAEIVLARNDYSGTLNVPFPFDATHETLPLQERVLLFRERDPRNLFDEPRGKTFSFRFDSPVIKDKRNYSCFGNVVGRLGKTKKRGRVSASPVFTRRASNWIFWRGTTSCSLCRL